MSRRTRLIRQLNPDTVEEALRAVIEKGVDVFGFAGVLQVLADEAEKRVDDEEDSTQSVLDAIEAAIDEIEGGNEDDEEYDDDEDE